MPISAVLITLNEENVLEKTLRALAWADEIVVVDSGSTDATVAIAEQFGAKVFFRKFDGYGPQKHFAVAQASHDWVLALDADEVVTQQLQAEIISTLQKPNYQGYYVPISLIFLNRLLRFGGEYKMLHLRLFNKQFGNFNQKTIHEGVELTGKVGRLQHQLLHYSYADLHDYFQKFNHYTSRAAAQLHEQGKKASLWKVVGRFPLTFLKIYVLKLGFLDGYAGFVWALFSAMYPVVKYAKLREKNN